MSHDQAKPSHPGPDGIRDMATGSNGQQFMSLGLLAGGFGKYRLRPLLHHGIGWQTHRTQSCDADPHHRPA